MGKRSSFARVERDFYPTPYEAVAPLIPHIETNVETFIEPCAGDGALIRHLQRHDMSCVSASDIVGCPEEGIREADALAAPFRPWEADAIITNPPWSRDVLHRMIVHFSDHLPTWLLFDADWVHTRQAAPYLPRLQVIVSVGRVKWIKDSPHTGKDNCAWHLFGRPRNEAPVFYGRAT